MEEEGPLASQLPQSGAPEKGFLQEIEEEEQEESKDKAGKEVVPIPVGMPSEGMLRNLQGGRMRAVRGIMELHRR